MDCRGLEGKLTAVRAHTGPGLGVSTNKVPLAYLPAHWHTKCGNRNQFKLASLEQEAKHCKIQMCLHSVSPHTFTDKSSHTSTNTDAHDPQTQECQPQRCGCLNLRLFPLLLIFNAKFHNKLLKAISGFLKRQAIDLHQIMIESSVHLQLTDKCILNTQLCSL